VAIDQEGGRVARLRAPFTEWPPMAALGRAEPEEAERMARRFATALAAELNAVGVSLDFAPVLDIAAAPGNPAIGDRAFSADPERVAALGRVIVEELQRARIAACGKHFPGHGETTVDPHHGLPVLEYSPDRLRAKEFLPFRAAVDADVAAIMTAHVLVPALDEHVPATLSRPIVTGLLRDELHYDGIVFTDDLDMKGVSAQFSMGEIAVRALEAGCDGLLSCGTDFDRHAEALEAVIHAVEQERLPLSRIEEAVARHERAKAHYLPGEVPRPLDARALRDVVGRVEHQAISHDLRRFA
jgi:beta-N-acetylhexosaminidase